MSKREREDEEEVSQKKLKTDEEENEDGDGDGDEKDEDEDGDGDGDEDEDDEEEITVTRDEDKDDYNNGGYDDTEHIKFNCANCKEFRRNELAYVCSVCAVRLCFDCKDKTTLVPREGFPHDSSHSIKLRSIVSTEEEEEEDDEDEEEKEDKEEKNGAENEENETNEGGEEVVGTTPRKSQPYLQGPWETLDEDDISGGGFPPLTIIEQQLMALSATIREKENWFEKYKNEEIIAKWKEEAKRQSISVAQFNYVMKELAYYDSLRENGIEFSTVEGVWQSDTLINDELKKNLLNEISKLENVPEEDKDWHPSSNKQVLDLVHPSLYCLVNQVSKVFALDEINKEVKFDSFKKMGGGKELVEFDEPGDHSSTSYQWIPSEFDVSKDGSVKILSYINNLHPKRYAKLYPIIESIFEKFVPLFNRVLSDFYEPREYRLGNSPNYSRETRPKLPPFKAPSPHVNPIDLRGQTLQVIVKFADIILTPEKPLYKGGVWHVEGMENEDIVASGIYYFHSENITESRLRFRQCCYAPDYEQDDAIGVRRTFGLLRDGALNQTIGNVITKTNRMIAFPNVYQHQVAPFELIDHSQPGHRKILVFFLVNPKKRIVSTLETPPQQMSWYLDFLKEIGGPFATLPDEILMMIIGHMSDFMSLEEAKEHRIGLMHERSQLVLNQTQVVFERKFSMCEH